jgi:hypothetical protein
MVKAVSEAATSERVDMNNKCQAIVFRCTKREHIDARRVGSS